MKTSFSLLLVCAAAKFARTADEIPSLPAVAAATLLTGQAKLTMTERELTRYKYSTQYTVYVRKDGKATRTVSSASGWVKRRGDAMLLRTVRKGADTGAVEDVLVLNDRFMFGVRRTGAGLPWLLSKFSREDRQKEFAAALRMQRGVLNPLTADGLSSTIDETIADNNFSVASVTEKSEGRTAIAFSVARGGTSPGDQSGTITTSSRHNFAVLEIDRTLDVPGGKYREVCRRELDGTAGTVRAKSLRIEVTNLDTGTLMQSFHFDYSDFGTGALPPDEFVLAAYGIPEPTDPGALPASFYQGWKFWAATAMGCSALVAIFRRLATRR